MNRSSVSVSQNAVQQGRARRKAMQKRVQSEREKLLRGLTTPEGATLNLKLASAGERAGAFMIDFTIIMAVLITSLFAISYTVSRLGFEGAEIAFAMLQLIFFFLFNFYFIVFEMGKRAATPGKRLLGLRVAARNGGRLTANAVFARNFIREVEAFMPIRLLLFASFASGTDAWLILAGLLWTGLFLFFPLMNRDKLRAGDILAGTWVIHAPKIELLGDISSSKAGDRTKASGSDFTFTQAQIKVYGIHELHVLEDVLRKSSDEVKASVAERIRNKIGWTKMTGETDLAFLEAYYAALRQHLEQNLLLGKRKTDKFDKTL